MQSEYIFFRVPVGAGASHIHFRGTKLHLYFQNTKFYWSNLMFYTQKSILFAYFHAVGGNTIPDFSSIRVRKLGDTE